MFTRYIPLLTIGIAMGKHGTSSEVKVGRSRSLLRLGGDGYLTFHFESSGGRRGRLDPGQVPMLFCENLM